MRFSGQLLEGLHGGNVVVFSGAGMSTESGLPDFRSREGLWKHRDPRELASVGAMERNATEFQAFYRWRVETLLAARPNRGHELLAAWEREGLVSGVITQNVDGFHQQAGSRRVVELHGSLRFFSCRACGRTCACERVLESFNCEVCGGPLRPGVVLFGEPLAERAMDEAEALVKGAALLLVLGTSLQVAPANWYPRLAKAAGAKLFIVNGDPTPLDDLADYVLGHPIGEVLAALQDERLSRRQGVLDS